MKQACDLHPDVAPWLIPRWLLGFFMLGICATSIDVIVLGTLPLSVTAPFAGLTIVFSLLLASSGLFPPAEKLTRQDGFFIGLVLLGVTLVSAYGPHNSGTPSLDEFGEALTSPAFAGFVLVAYSAAFTRWFRVKSQSWAAPTLGAFAAASCGSLSQLMLKLFSTSLQSLPSSLPYAACALVGLVCAAPIHLRLLNLTLAGSSVSLAVPAYQFLMIACSTANGGLLFHEFAALPASDLRVYGLGVATAAAGLGALSRSSVADEDVELKSAASTPDGAAPSLDLELSNVDDDSIATAMTDDDLLPDEPPFRHRQAFAGGRQRAQSRGRRQSMAFMGLGLGLGHALDEARDVREVQKASLMRKRSKTIAGLPTPSASMLAAERTPMSRRMSSAF